MFRSVLTTGALPELSESLTWLPVDQCAQAVANIAMKGAAASQDVDLVYHLVNPKSFSWKEDLLPSLKQGSPSLGLDTQIYRILDAAMDQVNDVHTCDNIWNVTVHFYIYFALSVHDVSHYARIARSISSAAARHFSSWKRGVMI